MNNFQEEWVIFETIAGSQLYGTSTPESDIDKRGVCIPPKEVRDDPFTNFEEQHFQEDRVIYSLKKFFQLASDCNPNIIELLFAPTPFTSTWEWNLILSQKEIFLSTKARQTFVGYGYSQLKRIKLHREWLLNPPKVKPDRKALGLPDTPLFGLEKIDNLIHAPEDCILPHWKHYAQKERMYRDQKQYWDNYENWYKTRNPKRFELEAKFGYDTKHAMHLARLLTEGLELLTTGTITLPRPDKDFLLEIRNGKFTYDELLNLVGDFEGKINNCTSVLPADPNRKKISALYSYLTQD